MPSDRAYRRRLVRVVGVTLRQRHPIVTLRPLLLPDQIIGEAAIIGVAGHGGTMAFRLQKVAQGLTRLLAIDEDPGDAALYPAVARIDRLSTFVEGGGSRRVAQPERQFARLDQSRQVAR